MAWASSERVIERHYATSGAYPLSGEKLHFDIHEEGDRLPRPHGRRKQPGLECPHGLSVEAQLRIERGDDSDLADGAISLHHALEHHAAGDLGLKRVNRIAGTDSPN